MVLERKTGVDKVKEGKKWNPYLCAFLLPTSLMMLIFIIKRIYPFGDNIYLCNDSYYQYMPIFMEFFRKIKAGEALSYSFQLGLGTNFLAVYAYYLASPLHWLAFLVPEAYLTEFISYLVIVKIGLCGLTCCYYLRKHFGTEKNAAILFSLFYAMSGFMAAYNINFMWLDGVVLFPLIVLGLERLVKEGRCGLYCVTLALSILSNFYISIMICVFLVLYFGILLLDKRSWKIVGRFALYSLLAGGMASILLIPVLCAMMSGNTGTSDLAFSLESYFSVFEAFCGHFVGVELNRIDGDWPHIYCGVAMLLLLPLYGMNRQIPRRQRVGKFALLLFILLSFCMKILELLWHGMYEPDGFPARQSFIYIFLVLIMCYEAYEHIEEITRKQMLYTYLIVAGLVSYCMILVERESILPDVKLTTLLFLILYAAMMWLYRRESNELQKRKLIMTLAAVMVVECTINTFSTSVQTAGRTEYLEQLPDFKEMYEMTKEREESFYRLDEFSCYITKDDSAFVGYPSASVFSSISNYDVMETYKALGLNQREAEYRLDGATPFASALLNVDYMYGTAGYENKIYTPLEQRGVLYLYENNYTLPFGYVAPVGYDFPENSGDDSIGTQNQLVHSLGIEEELLIGTGEIITGDTIKYQPENPGIYYARLSNVQPYFVKASGRNIGGQILYSIPAEQSITYLGYAEAGDTIGLTDGKNDEEEELKEFTAEFFVLNEEVLAQALEILSARHMTDVEYDSTHLSGRLSLAEAGRLILSIPFDKGWTVMVNGEETEPELFGGSLMAFDLEAGEYEISMHYVPEGKYAGIVMTVVSGVLFAVLMVVQRKKATAEV